MAWHALMPVGKAVCVSAGVCVSVCGRSAGAY